VLPYRTEQPPTVTLPLAAAGIGDARAPFARVFEAELKTDPRFADDSADRWLHGIATTTETTASGATPPRAIVAAAADTVVIVVPGLFGDCLGPWSVPFGNGSSPEPAPGAALAPAYAMFAGLGLRGVMLAPLPGRASTPDNGERLASLLREQIAREDVAVIVLVAYSKGVADALHAFDLLAEDGAAPPKLRALVSVAGTVMGTPVADRFADLYEEIGRKFVPLDCTPSAGGELDSVTRAERLARLAAHPPPTGIDYYSIIAHQPRGEMSLALRPTARMLETIDPHNDGQVLAADAILPRSTLLAEARADHWAIALPRDGHPKLLLRAVGPRGEFPRDALFRATIRWVIEHLDERANAPVDADRPLPAAAYEPDRG
jgi:hypothetical protein